jgi:hypothetical protein
VLLLSILFNQRYEDTPGVNSYSLALRAIYPEHTWELVRKPSKHWQDLNNQRTFFDQLAIVLNLRQPEDWYNVQLKTVIEKGGSFVVRQYGSSLIKGKRKQF